MEHRQPHDTAARNEGFGLVMVQQLIRLSNEYIQCLGALILIVAAILCFVNIIRSLLFPNSTKRGRTNNVKQMRLELGNLTALGLELLVISDLLETLTLSDISEYSFELLGKICIVALFRTFLAYCLSREIKEVKDEILEEAGEDDEAGDDHDLSKAVDNKTDSSKLSSSAKKRR
jgi:uncharacterized membrane protein